MLVESLNALCHVEMRVQQFVGYGNGSGKSAVVFTAVVTLERISSNGQRTNTERRAIFGLLLNCGPCIPSYANLGSHDRNMARCGRIWFQLET
jgi:hypothetical protein